MALFMELNAANSAAESPSEMFKVIARAIEAAIVPPGYVVVPVEPTPEIITDGVRALYDASWGDFDAEREEMIATYRAMIAAAPKGQP